MNAETEYIVAVMAISALGGLIIAWAASIIHDERVYRKMQRESAVLRHKAAAMRAVDEENERRAAEEYCETRTAAGEMCDNCPRDGRCDALPFCQGKERRP